MERIIFKHLSGSKATEVDSYPLDQFTSVLVGRDPAATLRYDATRDDLVGRQHARIDRDPADPYRITVTDLESRNGTFVNRQRIAGPAVLSPGDVLQFGPGGPELEFTIDPLPEAFVAKTRLAPAQSAALEPTRVAIAATGVSRKPAVGAATVQRMVADAQQRTSRKWLLAGGSIAAMLVMLTGAVAWKNVRDRHVLESAVASTRNAVTTIAEATPMTAAQIAERYTDATVFVEMSWKLVAPEVGQIFHEHIQPKDPKAAPVPVYLRLADGSVEPSLIADRGPNGIHEPIGSSSRGSGFVVTNDGFILTNRHVAAPWETSYTRLGPGVLYDLQTRKLERLDQPPTRWVPAASKLLGRRAIVGKNVEGRLDYLDVTFARNRLRVPAKIVRISDKHDAALIKVDLPQPVTKVELLDNYDQIRPGMAATIMGYPAVSPEVIGLTKSDDWGSREAQARVVPDPTVTPTAVGRVLRGSEGPAAHSETEYFSEIGDSYQLAHSPGGGNSGGPLFDDRGRVIGIYSAWRSDGRSAVVGFAVPIRYGIELMGVSRASR